MGTEVMQVRDISSQLLEQVKTAADTSNALRIRGGGSKDFYGREPQGEILELGAHRGIVNYEPTELVVTARTGTPLSEIEKTLAEHNQMLAFEPPHFGEQATVGGTIACNLSGPRRAYAGAARDSLLGTKLLNGRGEILSFGGEVMKNVAGYDVSRLMAGAMGTLGVLLEVSLKVLPRPEQELTLVQEVLSPSLALDELHAWARMPVPISASCYHGKQLFIRLCGTPSAVKVASDNIGGEPYTSGSADTLWQDLKNHRHGFFESDLPLWRLSVASDASPIKLDGQWLYEWGGAQRWLLSDAPAETVREAALAAGGHATLYRHGSNRDEVFQPLGKGLMQIHRRLKQAFDPKGIFNPGRMYRDL
jgi:glycolate oxidase FAD binding subunit